MKINPRLLINEKGKLLRDVFVPCPLQEIEKKLVFDVHILEYIIEANNVINHLENTIRTIDSYQHHYFYNYCILKETISTLKIHGTAVDYEDVFLKIQNGKPENYAGKFFCVTKQALNKIDTEKMNAVFLKELHAGIITDKNKYPGHFRPGYHMIYSYYRHTQFYPPLNEDIVRSLADLEEYINNSVKVNFLIKASLIHYQLVTISPFADGNNRLARLCNLLYLKRNNSIGAYAFYVSHFILADTERYYRALADVRNVGDYQSWVEYYLRLVISTVEHMRYILLDSVVLLKTNQIIIIGSSYSKFEKNTMFALLDYMVFHPVATILHLCRAVNKSFPTVSKAVKIMVSLGMLESKSHYRHSRAYIYRKQLDILTR